MRASLARVLVNPFPASWGNQVALLVEALRDDNDFARGAHIL